MTIQISNHDTALIKCIVLPQRASSVDIETTEESKGKRGEQQLTMDAQLNLVMVTQLSVRHGFFRA